ncbi:MAG: SGNH/GDSL hydrolase family protein [Planctomycetota bacterium]
MALIFKERATILFVGDSITDGGRTRTDPRHLGLTYAGIAAGMIQTAHPELRLQFYNRGIGGDSVRELAARWERDVTPLAADWISISIGINDVWRTYKNSPNAVPLDEFTATYRRLAAAARAAGARLILMETSIIEQDFASPGNVRLEPFNAAIRAIAVDHDAVLVRTRDAFRRALAAWPDYQWTNDGIHTSCEGSVLMARAWLYAVGFDPDHWFRQTLHS